MTVTADHTGTQPKFTIARRSWRHVIMALIGVVGTLSSIGMFIAISGWRAHLDELRFTNLATDHLQTINNGLQDATELLYSVRAYFESLDALVTRTEFQTFSQRLRARVPGLRDIGWAPRVTKAERDRFERNICASGIPDFQIKERNADGKMVRAADRPEYFPILYLEPGDINRTVLGFDVGSETLRRRAIALALATDRPAATPPLQLANQMRANSGMMSFIPVTTANAGPAQHPRPVAGVVLGAFETGAMIEAIRATKVRLMGLDMFVFDFQRPGRQPLDLLAVRQWQAGTDGSLADGRPALARYPGTDRSALGNHPHPVRPGGQPT